MPSSRPAFLPLLLLGGVIASSTIPHRLPSNAPAKQFVSLGGIGNTSTTSPRESDGEFRLFDGGEGKVQMVLPDEHSLHAESPIDSITVTKSADYYRYEFPTQRKRWRFLGPEKRKRIDQALSGGRVWERIVIHATGSETGNLRILDTTHRKRYQREVAAYHFIIGNGTHSGSGEIEVSARWELGEDDGALNVNETGLRTLSICLVGDLNQTPAREEQLESLHELVGYLRAKLGVVEVVPHRQLESAAQSCPGRYFPDSLFQIINGQS